VLRRGKLLHKWAGSIFGEQRKAESRRYGLKFPFASPKHAFIAGNCSDFEVPIQNLIDMDFRVSLTQNGEENWSGSQVEFVSGRTPIISCQRNDSVSVEPGQTRELECEIINLLLNGNDAKLHRIMILIAIVDPLLRVKYVNLLGGPSEEESLSVSSEICYRDFRRLDICCRNNQQAALNVVQSPGKCSSY